MKVLFDHCIPHFFSSHLDEFKVFTARYLKWDNLSDEELIEAAEENDFSALLTVDTDFLAPARLYSEEVGIVVANIHPTTPPHLKAQSDRINDLLLAAVEESNVYELTEEKTRIVTS
jgi:predicted nuclease of predicted toxin-antitoxin system